MFVEANGINLYYEKCGSGRPLILTHCNSMSHKIFHPAIKVLSKYFTVYAVDSRDHGRSTKVKTIHYDDMVEDMRCFIVALDIEKPIFYGFSDGGIIGLMLAAKYPELLSKLIVSGASVSPESTKDLPMFFFKVGAFFVPTDKMKLMLREPNITDEMLSAITVPTFVTCGSRDVIRPEHSEHIAQTVPGAVIRVFEGEGHTGYIMYSRKIADYILSVTEDDR